jgi:hypothetical protein
MNNKTNINPDAIISIEVQDKHFKYKYTFIPAKPRRCLWPFFVTTIIPAHYINPDGYNVDIKTIYDLYDSQYDILIEKIDNNIYVYRKPLVKILTTGGYYPREYVHYFDTYEEAADHQIKLSNEYNISVIL